jgi:filamentous hemagglutinin family protein
MTLFNQKLKRHIFLLKRLIFPLVLAMTFVPVEMVAQIAPDGSVSTTVRQLEKIMKINGGEREGNNLFHSFEEFSVPEGFEAVFENATEIENIFTRITGESVSNIEGILKTQGGANFFLVNPNGIIFGENASLDIGGSFIATTANSVQFENGTEFAADDAREKPIITVSMPIGLQFDENSGAITVNGTGNQIISGTRFSPIEVGYLKTGISVNPGKTLALIGNQINFPGSIITAGGGRIEIGSVNSGLVSFQKAESGLTFGYNNALSYQDITLSEQALLDTSGEGRGAISLTGNNVTLSNGSFLLNQNRGNVNSDSINIKAFESLNLLGSSSGEVSSSIRSESVSLGQASDINISTKQLLVSDEAQIRTGTYSEAYGKNIIIDASDSIKLIGGSISNSTFAQGDAGDISISTSQLKAIDAGGLTSATVGTGDGGEITVDADLITLVGGSAFNRSSISASSFNAGNAGNLNIKVRQLQVQDGASVSSSSFANGNAGNLNIDASESIKVSGINQNFQASSNPNSTISSGVLATSSSGRIGLNLPTVTTGNAGNVTLNTPSLMLSQQGNVTVENQGTGNGGTLYINAERLNVSETGKITAATASGDGGNINLDTNDLQIDEGSQITAEAGNNADGGNIKINTTTLIAKKNTNLSTSAISGDGGNIKIDSNVILGLENSDIIANAVGGNGGNIKIDSNVILGLEPRAQLTPFNDIAASSELGIDGTIEINSPNNFVDDELLLTINNLEFDSTAKLIEQSCFGANRFPNASRIITLGRGSVPESPDNYFDGTEPLGYLQHRRVPATGVTPNPQPEVIRSWQPGDPIVEANAVKIEKNGSTSLIVQSQIKSPGEQYCQR